MLNDNNLKCIKCDNELYIFEPDDTSTDWDLSTGTVTINEVYECPHCNFKNELSIKSQIISSKLS